MPPDHTTAGTEEPPTRRKYEVSTAGFIVVSGISEPIVPGAVGSGDGRGGKLIGTDTRVSASVGAGTKRTQPHTNKMQRDRTQNMTVILVKIE